MTYNNTDDVKPTTPPQTAPPQTATHKMAPQTKRDGAATAVILALCASVIAGAFLLASPWKNTQVIAKPAVTVVASPKRPIIEVVFAIDTTGSMSGLLESAKQKVWTIANQLMSGQPRPTVRFGLVFYRDKSDSYVTQSTPLTDDIDAVYEALLAASASGGGDNPEHVNRALEVAIDDMQWRDGDNVLKLIFLVGDAPPHDDYQDTPTSIALTKRAAAKHITVNPILVGQNGNAKIAWQKIAVAGGGHYAAIAQDGGTIATSTPFDRELERYNHALADSVVYYGGEKKVAKARAKFDSRKRMKGEVASSAASFSSAKGGYLGSGDLLSAESDGRASIETLPQALAPTETRGMTASQKRAWLDGKKKKRKQLSDKIAKLSKKRAQYLRENKRHKKDSFDDNVFTTLRKQAKKVGIALE